MLFSTYLAPFLISLSLATSISFGSDRDLTYHRIRRTLANTTVTVTSPCRPPLSQCLVYCDKTLQAGQNIDSDCAGDCEDDLCEFGSVDTPIIHEGRVTTFARFARLASEAKSTDVHIINDPKTEVVANPEQIGVAFNDCSDTCKTFADAAIQLHKGRPPGIIENLGARATCKAICASLG